jgi:hypothetical protein
METEKKISDFFDSEFYLSRNPDVQAAGLDPVTHYDCFGWKEGRDPSPNFSTKEYLAHNPDILKDGTNPLKHFIESISQSSDKNEISDRVLEVVSREFDESFYKNSYSTSFTNECDPILYFCERGWREGHDPNHWFSTCHYLTDNADIKESGVNPFWHYLVAGRDEGRTPKGHQCWQTDAASNLQSLEKTKRDWLQAKAVPKVFETLELQAFFTREFSKNPILVSFSHDDYRTVPGGVQLCIGIEKQEAMALGIRHLNLHPWQMLPTLADKNADPILCMVLDGELLGHARTSVVGEAIAGIRNADVSIVCHHLVGHSIEGVVSIAKSAGASSCNFWLHDYFGICTSYTLMRNNIIDCGAPDAESNACSLCVFGEERRSQINRFTYLFDSLEVHLISPSSIALDLWHERSGLTPKSWQVHPHVVLQSRSLPLDRVVDFPEPVRLAFIGALSPHKGWPVFQQLKKQIGDDPRFEFWLFSATEANIPNVNYVHVHAQSTEPHETMSALRKAQIDIVVHWAAWQETFSFSTFEALAAGAFVVTNENSGNVARAVTQYDAGLVLDSTEALNDIAQGDGLIQLADRSRMRRTHHEYDMVYSDMAVSGALKATAAA